MAESSPLKTVRVNVECVHEDGSTTVVTTNELDASGVMRCNTKDMPSHAMIGTSHPFHDEERQAWSAMYYRDWSSIHDRGPEFFTLDIQLPVTSEGMKEKGWIYQTKHTEKPTNRMFFRVHRRMAYGVSEGKLSLINQTGTEEEVRNLAEQFPTSIFFMAEVPA